MIKKITLGLVFTLVVGAISGCVSRQSVEMLDTTARQESTTINKKAMASIAAAKTIRDDKFVVESMTPLLGGRPAPVRRVLPEMFGRDYFFNPNGEKRLIDVIKLITADTGMVITARDDVYNPTSTRISATDSTGAIDSSAVQLANDVRTESNLEVASRVILPAGSRYSGSVEGFLDYLTSVLNISWEYLHEENRVLLTRYIEKSYRLFVPPIGVEQDASNIWEDTEKGIEHFLSQGGNVSINQQAGTISVLDTKDVHQMVDSYMKNINRSLQRSVYFDMEIIAVTMKDSDLASLDMSFMHTSNRAAVDFGSSGSSIPSSTNLMASVASGGFKGSKLIQQNLGEKAEVSVSMSRGVLAMNNQKQTVSQTKVIPVITEFTPPVVSDGVVTQGGVTMTDVEVGFKISLTPSVMSDGQNMVLGLDMETSYLDDIVNVPVGEDGQMVQQAQRTMQTYQQVFSLRNSETMVVSGFSDIANEFRQRKPRSKWLSWLSSSRNDTSEKTYYVVLITPAIYNGSGMM